MNVIDYSKIRTQRKIKKNQGMKAKGRGRTMEKVREDEAESERRVTERESHMTMEGKMTKSRRENTRVCVGWMVLPSSPVPGAQGKNPQGLTELFIPLPPHLDDTPSLSIKGRDAVYGQTGGRAVRLGHTHAVGVLHRQDIKHMHRCTDMYMHTPVTHLNAQKQGVCL